MFPYLQQEPVPQNSPVTARADAVSEIQNLSTDSLLHLIKFWSLQFSCNDMPVPRLVEICLKCSFDVELFPGACPVFYRRLLRGRADQKAVLRIDQGPSSFSKKPRQVGVSLLLTSNCLLIGRVQRTARGRTDAKFCSRVRGTLGSRRGRRIHCQDFLLLLLPGSRKFDIPSDLPVGERCRLTANECATLYSAGGLERFEPESVIWPIGRMQNDPSFLICGRHGGRATDAAQQ